MEYLAIRNWETFQSLSRSGKWIKDYTDQSGTDADISKLSMFARGVLQELRRLRGKLGKNVPYDMEYILSAIHALGTDRPHVHHTIGTLISRGFLIVSNQAVDSVNSSENKKEKENKKEPKSSARAARGGNTQTAKATGETRHTRVKQLVQGFYGDWAGVECPWDGSEAKQLDSLLKSTPNWVDSQFVTCLENLARSDCVAPGARPREWLGMLPKFLKGPLDQFKNPKAVTNGKPNPSTAREQRIRERSERVLGAISGGIPTALSNGNGRRGVPGLAANAQALSAGGDHSGGGRIDAEPSRGMDGNAKVAGLVASDSSGAGQPSGVITPTGRPEVACRDERT